LCRPIDRVVGRLTRFSSISCSRGGPGAGEAASWANAALESRETARNPRMTRLGRMLLRPTSQPPCLVRLHDLPRQTERRPHAPYCFGKSLRPVKSRRIEPDRRQPEDWSTRRVFNQKSVQPEECSTRRVFNQKSVQRLLRSSSVLSVPPFVNPPLSPP